MKIEQDARIATQIAKALQGHDGPVHIEVNLNANGNQEANIGSHFPKVGGEDFLLVRLIDSLPEPRLRNLIQRIYNIAFERFESTTEAAKWLGVSYAAFWERNLVKGPRKKLPRLIETVKGTE